MKRRWLIAILLPTVLVVVAALVITGAVPMGTVVLHLDNETYHPNDTVAITLRSLHTGAIWFGEGFEVQRFEDGNWVEVPLDRFWRLMLMHLLPGETFPESFIPAEDFVETPGPGRYRVVKQIQVGAVYYRAALEKQTLYAEFYMEPPTSGQ